MKVEAKDIPIIQSFMTEYWKAIGELSDDRKILSSLEFNMTGVNPL